MVLVGVQPRLTQVPPTSSTSITAVFLPALARAVDSGPPPWPAPITIASYVAVIAVPHSWISWCAMGESTPTAADTLRALIRFDTTNPPGRERPCLEFLRGLFGARGISGQMLGASLERPNLVVRVPGRGEAPPLLMQGHGALDMKGGVAMMVTALLRCLDGKLPPAGDVVLCCLADEEAGGAMGA